MRRICRPCSLAMLSGWNCTPNVGRSRCCNAHDESLVALRADLEFGGRARSLDDERVVAGGGEGAVQTAKESARIVRNARHLAVHRRWRAHDVAAERLPDRLMAKADAKHRRRFARRADEIETDARFVRRAGAGREDDRVRLVGEHIGDGDLIVAPHRHVRPQLAKVMDEVEGEAVIVVDQRDALHPGSRDKGAAFSDAAPPPVKLSAAVKQPPAP